MIAKLEIQNLKCGGCEASILKKLHEIKSIQNININQNTNTVTFDYKIEEDLIKVKQVLLNLGYPVAGQNNGLGKKVKSYVSCALGRMQ